MTDEEVMAQPCEECGGACEVTHVDYSFHMRCTGCGATFYREGVEGMETLLIEALEGLVNAVEPITREVGREVGDAWNKAKRALQIAKAKKD